MARKHLHEIAREKVEEEHPPPKHEPIKAGVVGLVVGVVPVGVLLSLARIDINIFAGVIAIMAVIGFAIGYFYSSHLWSEYYDRVNREWMRLEGKKDA